jgi:hypothetical protein
MWPQIFIERNKIQVHAIQDQFNTHQHGDEVFVGKETIHTNEE